MYAVLFMEELVFKMIQGQIGYDFKNPDLLRQAFVRRSYTDENGGENNEVLEFIGDKALDFAVVRLLTQRFGHMTNGESIGFTGLSAWEQEKRKKKEYGAVPQLNEFICSRNEGELTKIKSRMTFPFNYDYSRLHFHCELNLLDTLPIFRGFGSSKSEARVAVCKLAYEYLQKNNLLFSIQDEIKDPNKSDAINQLEILARRGYFSIPTYDFEQSYDKDGNPIWKCKCHIKEYETYSDAQSSSKKDAKKSAAFKMLDYVLSGKNC